MADEADETGLLAFEARLAVLAEKVRAGFPERARELRCAVDALGGDEPVARDDVRRHAHKVRGTAGSHGFAELTELASIVEGMALREPREIVAREARLLADALDRVGARAERPVRAPDPISEVQPKAATLAGLRIAAVDDDASTRKLLALTLVNVGRAEALVEERAGTLLERLEREHFDVVIVDAMMPEMNGLACLQRIVERALDRAGTRYFVLSAATSAELAWTLPEALRVGWLRKPFRPRELVDAIAVQLGR
jgi:CheY-like chemotaxis protein